MTISLRSVRGAAAGAVGAGALTGVALFGGMAVAQAAPTPAPATNFTAAGPHGPDVVPTRGGPGGGGPGGGGGRDHDGPGQGGWGRGGGDHDGPGQRGWGTGGDWDRGGNHGDWDRGDNHGDWDHHGDWDRGGNRGDWDHDGGGWR
jgi:hypothetical protein